MRSTCTASDRGNGKDLATGQVRCKEQASVAVNRSFLSSLMTVKAGGWRGLSWLVGCAHESQTNVQLDINGQQHWAGPIPLDLPQN